MSAGRIHMCYICSVYVAYMCLTSDSNVIKKLRSTNISINRRFFIYRIWYIKKQMQKRLKRL